MKVNANILLMAFWVFFSCHMSVNALSKTDAEFVAKYAVDPEVKTILDKHSPEIIAKVDNAVKKGRTEHTTWEFSWLPGYIVKLNLARIQGMERMKRAIKKHNLDLLILPDKRIYNLKGRSEKVNSLNYVVVVKKIETDPLRKPLTLRHVSQLVTLMLETEYISLTADNYIRTYNDKIALIDTESNFDIKQLLNKGYIRLIAAKHNLSTDYTDEAVQHILTQMASLLVNQKGAVKKSLHKEILEILAKPQNSKRRDYGDFFEKAYARAQ